MSEVVTTALVAIEWAHYVFILLSGGLVVVGLVGDRLNEQRNIVALQRLDINARIAFPAVVMFTALAYFCDLRLTSGLDDPLEEELSNMTEKR